MTYRIFQLAVLGIVSIGLSLSWSGASLAQEVIAPLDDDHLHLGVESCAGSQCHSRQVANGPVVRQNEIMTWRDPSDVAGSHARAYDVLGSDMGQRIARRLGIGNPQESDTCLSCHSHRVDADQRGDGFDLSEGVTCEACHGGAGPWLSVHNQAGTTHADNLAAGLYPTTDVAARAGLCLDCHFGSERQGQFVTHRIMGAGHPRISFELELFTALQQHHTVDTDYVERKGPVSSVQSWAVGQAMAMERSASLIAVPRIGQDGLFPELYFFDCHTCHQVVSVAEAGATNTGWRPNPLRPLGPGVPVYNDANHIMLQAAVAEVAPGELPRLKALTRQLHSATRTNRGAVRSTAKQLATLGERLQTAFLADDFDQATATAILNRILDSALTAQYTNYAAGEQAVIAVDVFLNAMVADGSIDPQTLGNLQGDIDRAFDAVQRPETYNVASLRSALSRIRQTTRTF